MKKMNFSLVSSLVIVGVFIIIILINAIAGQLSEKFSLNIDLTTNKVYELSSVTKEVVEKLDTPVTFYILATTVTESPAIKEFLTRYSKLSDKIKIVNVNLTENPEFAYKYSKNGSTIPQNSVICENSDGKFKVIPNYDFFRTSEFAQYSLIEQKLTSALNFLLGKTDHNVYMTSGHEEKMIDDIKNLLTNENYFVDSLNLLSQEIPSGAEGLLISSPSKDFSDAEIAKIDTFLANGGKLYTALEPSNIPLPNLSKLFSEWGVTVNNDIVSEQNSDKLYKLENLILFAPEYSNSHTATSFLKTSKSPVLVDYSRSLTLNFAENNGIKTDKLLYTSKTSYGMIIGSQTKTNGPLNILVSSVKNGGVGGKIIVSGTSAFTNKTLVDSYPNISNYDMFLSSMLWLLEDGNALGIAPKAINSEKIMIGSNSAKVIGIFVSFVIPALILIFGMIVWMRRKFL